MNDQQIRATLLRKLSTQFSSDPTTIILEELGLKHGSARIDIAVINGRIHGFEIKSDEDTLDRLPVQERIFSSVLDRITLVVGYRHAYDALQIVPEWWGVKLAEETKNGKVFLTEARSPKNNPSLDPIAVASLLWREEALKLLKDFNIADGVRSKPRVIMYQRLVEVLSVKQLQKTVREQLKSRTNWRSEIQQKSCDD